MNLKITGLFCFLNFCITAGAFAQHATFTGSIQTESGNPVSGAYLLLEGKDSDHRYSTAANADGRFQIRSISPGIYHLTIRSLGFKTVDLSLEFKEKEYKEETFSLEPATYRAGTMVVTASRTQKELEDVSVPVTVIDNEEIERTGSTRLSDILAEQTGLNIISDHGTGIQLQGFDPDYTLIMIDNQPVIGRTAGTLNLDRISVGDVKQIEMVKGPSSALWGSDALAGVINIITEKPRESFGWDMNGQYGSNSSFDGGTNLNFRTDKLKGSFFGNVNGSDGYDLNKESIEPTAPEYQSYTFSGGLEYRFNPNISLGVQSRYYREDQSYLSDLTIDEEDVLMDGSEFQENYSITPELTWNIGTQQLFEVTTFFSRFDSESQLNYVETGDSYSSSTFDQTLNKYEIKSSTFWNEDHTTVAGVGMNREDLIAEIYADVPTFNSYFTFGQHEWELSQKLSLTAGFRFDAHSEYSSQFSPKFSGLYKPNDLIHIRASLGGGFKAPEFRQLFLNFTNAQVGYSVFGSSTVEEGIEQLQDEGQIKELLTDPSSMDEIKAEHSFAYNAGVDLFPTEGIQLRINAFRNNVEDLIETQRIAVKTNDQSVFSYFNLNRIYTQGIETELRLTPAFTQGLQVSLGYQFLDAQRQIQREYDDVVDGEVITITEEDYIPMFNRSRHTWNAKFFYTIDRIGLDSSLRIRYRGKYWFADYNNNQTPDANEYAEDVDSFKEFRKKTIINASLGKVFFGKYRLQLGVENLMDYSDSQFSPSNPGRTYYAQLNIKLY